MSISEKCCLWFVLSKMDRDQLPWVSYIPHQVYAVNSEGTWSRSFSLLFYTLYIKYTTFNRNCTIMPLSCAWLPYYVKKKLNVFIFVVCTNHELIEKKNITSIFVVKITIYGMLTNSLLPKFIITIYSELF